MSLPGLAFMFLLEYYLHMYSPPTIPTIRGNADWSIVEFFVLHIKELAIMCYYD